VIKISTNFPTNLDSYTTKANGDTIAEGHINDPQDAIEAIEAKLGIDGSADTSSHDYKLAHLDNGSVLDGDVIDIDWNPSHYTPNSAPAEASDVDDLTAHLYGIDQVLANVGTPNNSSVSQAKLKTSIGSVSCTKAGGGSNQGVYTLPGGTYGFYPQTRAVSSGGSGNAGMILGRNHYNVTDYCWQAEGVGSGVDTGYVTYISLVIYSTAANVTAYAQQRYITASGEVHWIFILKDKKTQQIISTWQAPDHPCFGNGGKPLLTPHPFGSYDPEKHEIIVINPPIEEVQEILKECEVEAEDEPDKDFLQVIQEHYRIDETVNPPWPKVPVTVKLPKTLNGQVVDDWRFMPRGTIIQPVKKVIPETFKTARLKLRS